MTLIEDHLELVDQVAGPASRKLPPHADRGDLRGALALALVQAAHAYNPTLGVPFGAYAYRRLQGAAIDHMRRLDHLPRNTRAAVKAGTIPAPPMPVPLDDALDKPSRVDVANDVANRVDLRRALRALPERHRAVVVATYLREIPSQDVARTMQVHPSRVSQIRAEALTLLRDALTA